MHVVIDGLIFDLQSHGGISRIYQEILPRICDIEKSLHLTLLTSGGLDKELPLHSRISNFSMPHFVNEFSSRRLNYRPANMVRELIYGFSTRIVGGDIWHSTYYTDPFGWNGKRVVTVADMLHERFSDQFNDRRHRKFRTEKKRCIKKSDAIICISETTRQDFEHYIGVQHDSVYVIPLAYSDVFRVISSSQMEEPDIIKRPFLLFLGNRGRYKNFRFLADVYSRWSLRKDVSLVVVGKQWSSQEQTLIRDLGISSNIQLLSGVDDEQLCALYNIAVALVHPSLYEGFGIPLLEAMACGCPIVASRIPSTMEVAGRHPIYFDPYIPDELMIALDSVVEEGKKSIRVQQGMKHVASFSWQKTAMQTLDVYKELADRP